MKRIVRLTEKDLSRIVRRVIRENEEEWIDQSMDMEGESDFSKMDLKQSAKNATRKLTDEEKDILRDFIENNGMEEFQNIIEDQLESVISEDEMSDNEYRVREIIDKIIGYSSVISGLAIVPAAMAIGAGAALALGVYSLASNTLRDAAWFKRGGKFKDHHYGPGDKSRRKTGL